MGLLPRRTYVCVVCHGQDATQVYREYSRVTLNIWCYCSGSGIESSELLWCGFIKAGSMTVLKYVGILQGFS